MSKLLANQIANYNDNGPVEVKEGVNIPTGKPFQVAGATGTSGQFLKSTGSSVEWETFPAIPAAQVNADWSAGTGVAQILNKPVLATVATSGSYTDLTNLPTIPSAQIQSDWNQTQTGYADFIKNKPTIFSGNYTDLSGKPTIPATLNDLADINIPIPNDGEYVKWDATTSRWVGGTGSAGLIDVIGDTTPQLGGVLDANGFLIDMGNNEITDIKVGQWDTAYSWGDHSAAGYLTSDTNTEYSQSSMQDGGNVKLRLSSSTGTQDDILLTAGSGIAFTNISAGGFTIDSSGGGSGGASVTVADAAPGTPSSGDLWWKSNEARLKVFYDDGSGTQWVDASPPLAATTMGGTGTGGNSLSVTNTGTEVTGTLITDNISWGGHMLPSQHEQFDIGSAEYKIRHIFVSDNSIYMGDEGATIKSEGTAIVVQDLKTGDLHLDNTSRTFMGHQVGNDIDGTSGSWTFQEGSADLYLLNNMSGKRYKINLTEV